MNEPMNKLYNRLYEDDYFVDYSKAYWGLDLLITIWSVDIYRIWKTTFEIHYGCMHTNLYSIKQVIDELKKDYYRYPLTTELKKPKKYPITIPNEK